MPKFGCYVSALALFGCSHPSSNVPCTDANIQNISASNYDQTCRVDSDCVAVGEGNACYPCVLECRTATINLDSLGQYQSDVAKTIGGHEQAKCNCPNEVVPRCQNGKCRMTR
jgi:hypothetical protein